MFQYLDDDNIRSVNINGYVENRLQFSAISQIQSPLVFNHFSIKYVLEGNEQYHINGEDYSIHPGQLILTNNHAEGSVKIISPKPVRGLCIDIHPEIMAQVTGSLIRPDTAEIDLSLDKYFTGEDFLERKVSTQNSHLGQYLEAMAKMATPNLKQFEQSLTKEVFFILAEKAVMDHLPVVKQLRALNTVKSATRKDLFRKVERGKEYLETHFLEKVTVAAAAHAAAISEYHFFRLFKKMYGVSPLQMVLHRRLNFAYKLINEGGTNLTQIAYLTNFTDMAAFSKAFKKQFGKSPSQLLQ